MHERYPLSLRSLSLHFENFNFNLIYSNSSRVIAEDTTSQDKNGLGDQ